MLRTLFSATILAGALGGSAMAQAHFRNWSPQQSFKTRNKMVDLYRDRAKLQNISALHSRSSV